MRKQKRLVFSFFAASYLLCAIRAATSMTGSIQHKEQRVGIFVDVQNLYHSAKHLYHGRVNYRELVRNLVGNRKLVRIIGYVVKSENIGGSQTFVAAPQEESGRENKSESGSRPSSEAAFFEALQDAGLELRIKDLQIYPGGMKKADWDVGMAVDAIRVADLVDTIVLVTGDGDFVPLVEYLKWGMGRQVEVAAFGRSTSMKLKETADKFINIDDIPKIIINKTAESRRPRFAKKNFKNFDGFDL